MERVRLVHGNGGRFSHELTERFILKYFTNDLLAPLHDGAQFPVTAGRMAFSTDSYVVQPAFSLVEILVNSQYVVLLMILP